MKRSINNKLTDKKTKNDLTVIIARWVSVNYTLEIPFGGAYTCLKITGYSFSFDLSDEILLVSIFNHHSCFSSARSNNERKDIY